MRLSIVGFLGVASATFLPTEEVFSAFEQYRAFWGKEYTDDDYTRRAAIFAENMESMKEWQQSEKGTAVYSHLSIFTDQSPDEMSQRRGYLPSDGFEMLSQIPSLNITLEDSLDWVAKGACNPIKNQGQCGSCWSFSAVANIEGAGFVTTGKLVSLSEQNIMDCDNYDNSCGGGNPYLAMEWAVKAGGIASEANYPYRHRNERCYRSTQVAHITGYNKISTDENQMAQALATYGPLSICLDDGGFKYYRHGVIDNPRCSKYRSNHCVAIVGYGRDGVDYWRIRNSWGTWWAEDGYVRMARGNCNCGLSKQVVTAVGITIDGAPEPTPPPTPAPVPPPVPPSPTPPPPVPPSPPVPPYVGCGDEVQCSPTNQFCPLGHTCMMRGTDWGCCDTMRL